MLVDHTGKPLPPKRSLLRAAIAKTKSWRAKGPATIAILVAITALLVNLDSVISLYERMTDGPTYEMTIEVSNSSETPIEVASLLDFHIAITPFHSGRLLAGEAPSGRVKLRLVGTGGAQSPYTIAPGGVRTYVAEFRRRPYENQLGSGGSNIVFVLRIENSEQLYYIEQPFQSDVMQSLELNFKIE